MQPITATITPGDTGPRVVHLQDALLRMLSPASSHPPKPKLILTHPAPDKPTQAELQHLTDGLRRDRALSTFGEATAQLIWYYQIQEGLGDGLRGVVDDGTAAKLNVVLEGIGEQRVEGRLVFDYGLPAAGVRVRIYHRGFGGEEVHLGDAHTDESGFYVAPYELADKAANVEVRVIGSRGEEISLSKTKFGAEPREQLNLVAPAVVRPLASEYERLAMDLSNELGELGKIAGSRENAEHQDLTLLRRAIGWDARAISIAATTAKLSLELNIAPDVLYALGRVGLPTNKEQLAYVGAEAIELGLRRAQDAGIVKLDEVHIAAAMVGFRELARATQLSAKAPGALSSFRELLDASGANDRERLTTEEQALFADLYVSHRGAPEELWKRAADHGIAPEKVNSLRLQGKLALLTRNNAALTASLQREIASSDRLAALVEMDLHHSAAWGARLRELAGGHEGRLASLIPPDYAGKTVAERLARYSADLAQTVRSSFPTQVVARMVESDELRLADGYELSKASVSGFLKGASRFGFVLGRVSVATFVRENATRLDAANVPRDEATLRGVKQLQRLNQIAPNVEALKVVADAGFASAQDVVALSYDAFVGGYGEKFATRAEAQAVHHKARQVSAVTQNVMIMAKQMENAPVLHALSGSVDEREQAKRNLIKHFPSLESLFGSLDFCECEHCGSVLSPAAYFVDLLRFLDRSKDKNVWPTFLATWRDSHGGESYLKSWNRPDEEKTPFDALIERRPDLPSLPLTCENTNTAMPYIDQVNEILEYYVARGKLDEDAAYDTGGSTTLELLAEPQNTVSDAYDKLSAARYPLALPFDLRLESVRHFCEHLGTPLWKVLQAFRPLAPRISDPTNAGDATVKIPNADAGKVQVSDRISYYDVSAQALHDDSKVIQSIGVPGSGGGGNTLITLSGVWSTPPTADDLLVPTDRYYDRAGVFSEYLNMSPSEYALLTDASSLTAWHELYGYTAATPEIRQPTNIERATLSVLDAEAATFKVGNLCTYRSLGTGNLSDEAQIIIALAAPGSGGPGYTKLTFAGAWKVAPASGDLLVLDAVGALKAAKTLSRRLGVSYQEMIELVSTWFVNPLMEKLNVLRRFGLDAQDVYRYKGHAGYRELSASEREVFRARLSQLTRRYGPSTGFDAELWLDADWRRDGFHRILVLADPDTGCNFDQTTLRYASMAPADDLAFLKLNVFVRLWRKLGWTLEETDRALQAFVPKSSLPLTTATLGGALKHALSYIAQLKAVEKRLNTSKSSRLSLLTLWSNLATTGSRPLYAQLFLTASVLKNDAVFDDPLGNYLAKPGILLRDHLLAIQGALGLNTDEIGLILADAQGPLSTVANALATAQLSLDSLSVLYRYSLLAKALELSIRDFIRLKQLSGLDPFQLDEGPTVARLEEEQFWGQTLRFVEMAQTIKESALDLDDLHYLLLHRFDDSRNSRPNDGATRALLNTLSDAIRAIRAEHAAPAASAALSEEALRRKLALALPQEVVERFVAMLHGTVELTATRGGVQLSDKLVPEAFSDEPAIRELRYTPADLTQKLTFRGVLQQAEKERLTNLIPSPLFAELLDDVQSQAQTFFENQLQKQSLSVESDAGFLGADEFEHLFAPLKVLRKIEPGDSAQKVEEKMKENESIGAENQAALQTRRDRVAQAFLPYLQQRLIRGAVVAMVAAEVRAAPALVQGLLTDTAMLAEVQPSGARKPLLSAFIASAERGVTASFFASSDASGAPLEGARTYAEADTGLKDGEGKPLKPNLANSARFDGYLQVPATGTYRFFVALSKKGAEAELRFPDLANPALLAGVASKDDDELGNGNEHYLELKFGVPYRFTLVLRHLNGAVMQNGEARLLLRGERLPKGGLAQLPVYPLHAVERSERAFVLVTKTLTLTQSLGLTEREVRYLLTHGGDFGDLDLSKLPTGKMGASPAEVAAATTLGTVLFGQVLRLIAYARLKSGPGGGTEGLINLFEKAHYTLSEGGREETQSAHYAAIGKLMGRDVSTVQALVEGLGLRPYAVPELVNEESLARLWEALELVGKLGIPPAAVIDATRIVAAGPTLPNRRFEIARNLRNTVKARYPVESWQRIARPIFDQLRKRQRDALVAHIMHQDGFERAEQLFEYFLIDPGMEPVVQTSRIRLAISSVQTFIQRAFLNLEAKVHPATLNANEWSWMKRYRVWEANRKIFLFPENWLEPEFRDDKTHLFQELESALLQGDISAQLADDALSQYLKKLEPLASLDLVAMYREDGASPVLHVIGRTHALPHKYFYRRQLDSMWTPWEPVTAPIEGDHVAAVVWRQRLHLFWVTFLQKGKQGLRDITPAMQAKTQAPPTPTMEVSLLLRWSDYQQGQWSAVKSSDPINAPQIDVGASFDSQKVLLCPLVGLPNQDGEGALYLVLNGLTHQVTVGLNKPIEMCCVLRLDSNHTLPVHTSSGKSPSPPFATSSVLPTRRAGSASLRVTLEDKPIKGVLQNVGAFSLLSCLRPAGSKIPTRSEAEIAALTSPFFLLDTKRTFFVEPSLVDAPLDQRERYGMDGVHPGLIWAEVDLRRVPVGGLIPIQEQLLPIDVRSKFEMQDRADWLTDPSTLLRFDEQLVGEDGGMGTAVVPAIERTNETNTVAVVGRGLNVIGRGGLTEDVLQALEARRDASSRSSVAVDPQGGRSHVH